MTLSYQPERTVPGGLEAERQRLHRQAALTWDEEWEILRPRLDVHRPVLDLGCGPGEASRRISRTCPEVRVVSLDLNRELLTLAGIDPGPEADAAEVFDGARGRPLRAVCGDAARLPLRDGSMGTVLARYLFQHLPEPAAVLTEIRRVLQPGGWVVIIDVDEAMWGVCEPRTPGLESIYRAAATVQSNRGGSRVVIRSMTSALVAAGFGAVSLKPFAVDSGTRSNAELAVHLAPDRLVPALLTGAISPAEYGKVLLAHRQFLENSASYAMLLGFAAVGRVP